MTETLLQDLTGYKKGGDHKNKGVMMAARSLITLFREINPELLHRRDRGKDVSMSMAAGNQKKTLAYGEVECYNSLEATETTEASKSAKSDESDNDCELNIEDLEECDGSDLEEFDEEDDEECEFAESDVESEISDLESECPELVSSKPPAKKVRFLPSERLLLPEDYESSDKKTTTTKKARNSEDSDEESDSEASDESEGDEPSAFIDPSKIEGYRSRAKADYEARLASIHAGREGREKFGTRKRGNSRSSTTNKEKSKGKNFLMMAHKFEVKGKRRRSLKVRQAVQKKHKTNMKSRR